ncbi:hypothetical protein EFE42_05760 [Methanohalophilus sp. RSK]|uniref:hypothetical protein n=1 Tax=Methanohalophilus sp. RSK TaxID=2485783 RepID=UPI000F43CDB4|nr:hypothetical protein [Methanohalophilus sp. RSK]RNI14114.1 hypothetical protein EFE42_05760 [Methanohalophilus sp. RSK]
MNEKFAYTFIAICVLASIAFFIVFSLSDQTDTTKNENGTLRYFIRNSDNTAHSVTVEILDSQNISRFNKTYNISPNETLKPTPISLKKDTYLYEITLDNNITKRQITGEYPEDLDLELLIIEVNKNPKEPLILHHAIE